MSKACLRTPEWGDATPLNLHTKVSDQKQAPSSSLLTVNYLHALASTSSTNQGQTFAHPHLQHVEMSSVQDPSLKDGSAGGGVVPEDQQRVDAEGKRMEEFGLSSDRGGRGCRLAQVYNR